MEGSHIFILCGQQLQLLPDKAIFWIEEKAILIADTHFGKINHFRKAGIPLPDGAALNNFIRFVRLIKSIQPEKVYFLGDLFHSEMNMEWVYFKDILKKFPHIRFHLIQGNHDILHNTSYTHHFELHTKGFSTGPFLLTHEPVENSNGLYNLCGHIHPGIKLTDKGRQRLYLPCFYFGEKGGILPAFGEFTGLYMLQSKAEDQLFVISGQEVIRVK